LSWQPSERVRRRLRGSVPVDPGARGREPENRPRRSDACAEDVRITRQLIEAGKIIDIRVMDHIVIGRVGGMSAVPYLSMREDGLCSFEGG
jgi:hypothetical protein